MNENDFCRFQESLYVFNNALFVPTRGLTFEKFLDQNDTKRQPYVSILSYCLMPNHFHMLIRPLRADWMSKFMHRLITSYVMYFNIKYERTGRLFESEYKAVPTKTDGHFEHMARYIHLNALDLLDPK